MNRQQDNVSTNDTGETRLIQLPIKARARKSDRIPRVLERYQVCDWMQTPVMTVNPELRIERAWEQMARYGVRHLPVVKNDLLVGIVTERDLKRAVFAQGMASTSSYKEPSRMKCDPGDVPVEAIMTRSVSVATPSETLRAVALRMLRERVGALPVVSANGKLLGILTLSDLVRALLTQDEEQPADIVPSITLSTKTSAWKGDAVWVTQSVLQ